MNGISQIENAINNVFKNLMFYCDHDGNFHLDSLDSRVVHLLLHRHDISPYDLREILSETLVDIPNIQVEITNIETKVVKPRWKTRSSGKGVRKMRSLSTRLFPLSEDIFSTGDSIMENIENMFREITCHHIKCHTRGYMYMCGFSNDTLLLKIEDIRYHYDDDDDDDNDNNNNNNNKFVDFDGFDDFDIYSDSDDSTDTDDSDISGNYALMRANGNGF